MNDSEIIVSYKDNTSEEFYFDNDNVVDLAETEIKIKLNDNNSYIEIPLYEGKEKYGNQIILTNSIKTIYFQHSKKDEGEE